MEELPHPARFFRRRAVTGPEILTITGAAAALAVTPGPETILTIRLSSLRRRAGLVYALGTATGTVIWMVLALTGVSALLTVYPAAVQVLKIVGGLYLCFLGVLAARQAVLLRRSLSASTPSAQSSAPGAGIGAVVGIGAVGIGALGRVGGCIGAVVGIGCRTERRCRRRTGQ
jgi:threonine/homoserine/homoserine lactone efflux protein